MLLDQAVMNGMNILLLMLHIERRMRMFIKPSDGVLTNGFRTSSRPSHHGIDLAAKGAVPIFASAAGTVSRSYRSSSYGEVIFIKHQSPGQEWETVYAHLKEGSRNVKVGEKVNQGQRIGYMGMTGDATGQHLHFELHKGLWNGGKTNAVNPLNYINLKTDNTQNAYATVKVTSLNLRSGPSIHHPILKVLKAGETYKVYGQSNGWYNLGSGWASNVDNRYMAYFVK